MYGYEGAINTHTHSFPSVNDSPDICGQNFDVMVNSSSLDMYNHAPPATATSQIPTEPPFKNLMQNRGPFSSSKYIFGLLFMLISYYLTTVSPFDENYDGE